MAPFLTDHHPSAGRWPSLRAAAASLTLLLTTAAASCERGSGRAEPPCPPPGQGRRPFIREVGGELQRKLQRYV